MSPILIRFGLYTMIFVLAIFVLREMMTLPGEDLLTERLLGQMAAASVVLVAAGMIVRVFEKATHGRKKSKCSVCSRPVILGETYCREHLREMIVEEQQRQAIPPTTRR
ncbi:MAG TPA: hypothetical protein VMS56_16145 [Thermoanaerobaculia bacterium]|nr:hypothetical protein [Thermoanaerobaculia bacterium]